MFINFNNKRYSTHCYLFINAHCNVTFILFPFPYSPPPPLSVCCCPSIATHPITPIFQRTLSTPPPPIFSVLLPPRSDHVVVELSVTPLAPGPLRIEGITVSMGNATKLFRVGDKGQVRPMDHPH